MAKRSSEEFQKVSEVLCESPLDPPCVHPFFLNLLDSFSFALLSFDAVSLCFLFSLSSTITLGLPLLHFGSRTNFAICAVCRLLDSCSLKPHPSCSQLYQAFIPTPPPPTHTPTHTFLLPFHPSSSKKHTQVIIFRYQQQHGYYCLLFIYLVKALPLLHIHHVVVNIYIITESVHDLTQSMSSHVQCGS